MFITELKSIESLEELIKGEKVFAINCVGCKEISFPDADVKAFLAGLEEKGLLAGTNWSEYICNPENVKFNAALNQAKIDEADAVLVFSCGVGVQTVAEVLENKRVYAACNTLRLPGFQGVTPLDVDCGQCGECYLNETGGICPITACSKSLVNGQCGGSKNGKCEVNPEMECGWERIYRRLEKLGKLDRFDGPTRFHDYSTFEATKDHKE